ncbi:putative alpha,alpha-trehalose-phosphate synthase [UDP-forming] 11 [Drosera capensis]
MFSKSCLNLLNFDDFLTTAATRIPRVITASGIIDDEGEGGGGDGVFEAAERRIVVANQLPIRVSKEENQWRFELDHDAVVLQLKDGFAPGTEVIYVGCLKGCDLITDSKEQDEVSRRLFDEYRCLPVFLSPEIHGKFYHGFCKHYLWPLFHYQLPVSPVNHHGIGYDPVNWQAYVSANMLFADRITEVINPDDDFVWVHDYHLMVLPTILRRRFNRVRLGFFLHSPFPSSEIYRTIPVREAILKGLLNCDLVGFHTFDYARHFLSCCRRMFGLDYRSKRGYIGLEYYGRTVSIKILPVGIHMGQMKHVLSLPETSDKAIELKEQFEGKIVMVGVDDMDILKGISFKFLAMGRLLEENPELRGKVVLVQITNPPRSWGKDVQEVQLETRRIADEINKKYGKKGYEPIVFINGPVSTVEKAAYYAISDCCVVNAVRDGMNLVPYKYIVCRQDGLVSNKEILGSDGFSSTEKNSVIIVSEFIGCSPSLSGAIRVNPWNVDSVADGMIIAIRMPMEEKQLRHEKHYKYISSHDVAYWSRSFDQDLKRACADHHIKRCWGMGFGLGFRVIALDPDFRKLSVDRIVSAYGKTKSRLILLDYDGTVTPQASVDNAPGKEALGILNALCSDPKNIVFIVSGRGRSTLSKWFLPCERLGISAEHGYFTRWSKDSKWESYMMTTNFEWKNSAKAVMEQYTEATDGSYIEEKETAIVWHHQAADPDFGLCQAKELLDHLENVLANEPVVVKQGQHIVEVKPQDVSKGIAVENLIEAVRRSGNGPDFLLCIGDDRSDEDMFESITRSVSKKSVPANAEVFTCTVGQKPSMAKYYLDDSPDVINLLLGLAKASGQKLALA